MGKENDTKKRKSSLYKSVKSEYKKIIWPNKEDLIKQTKVVIVTSIIIGLVIVAYDFAFGYLIELLTSFVS